MLENAALASLLFATVPQGSTCPVTQPNHSRIPASVQTKAQVGETSEWLYGNDKIWTYLWPEGTVTFRKNGPGFILRDGSLQMKFLWLLAVDGPLSVSGRRVDGTAAPLRTDFSPVVGQGFQPSYLIFPTEGCWEVTARANGSEMTFVTKVVKTF
jgi:hypothetical protein